MGLVKSPGGSIFPYYYKGGEIHCLKYGSYFNNTEAVIDIMQAEEKFILAQGKRLKVWTDFYETALNDSLLHEFVESMLRIKDRVQKLAVVGPLRSRRAIGKYIKKDGRLDFPVQYFDDPEVAKTWLVHE